MFPQVGAYGKAMGVPLYFPRCKYEFAGYVCKMVWRYSVLKTLSALDQRKDGGAPISLLNHIYLFTISAEKGLVDTTRINTSWTDMVIWLWCTLPILSQFACSQACDRSQTTIWLSVLAHVGVKTTTKHFFVYIVSLYETWFVVRIGSRLLVKCENRAWR